MFHEKIFREDLRRYFLNDQSYDGSATAASCRSRCLSSVFSDLPWGVSEQKFRAYFYWLPGSWDIESKIEHCVDWVKRELESRPKPPKFY